MTAIVYKHPILGWRSARTQNLENFKRKLDEKGVRWLLVKRIPSLRMLEKWMDNGICPTPDGCKVEPDGKCCHGYDSWLLILGFI